MATLAVTIPAGGYAGSTLRKLGERIQEAAANVPDQVGTGASTVLTIDNAPATGVAGVQITAGPYTSASFLVG